MNLVSVEFLAFFFVVLGGFYLLPGRGKAVWLLAASYFFYGMQDLKYLAVLFILTLVSYFSGLLMKERKAVLIFSIVIQIGTLMYCKYLGFFTGGRLNSILLPVGISFFTLMSVGYLVDVFKKSCEPERDIISFALFVSFFPTILSGPIERGGHMLPQFRKENLNKIRFDSLRIRDGFVRILWGLFLKAVVADKIATMVASVYADPASHGGIMVAIAICLYTFQIYCDFEGYTSIAVGVAYALGIEVMENFKQPYLAITIADFWRRWHISLSSWLRDYIYIPLGGNRKGTFRKYINVLIVFLVSGLWHGANWTFIIWGLLHGMYQVIGTLLKPLKAGIRRVLKLEENSFSLRAFRVCFTFVLVSFAWIIFQAGNMSEVVTICKRLAHPQFVEIYSGGLYNLGLDKLNVWLVFTGIALTILVDILNEKKIYISKAIAKEKLWIRWPIYLFAILVILLCGAWGSGYSEASFIYQNF